MKTVVVAILALALAGCATDSQTIATSTLTGEDKIQPSCKEKWPDDWSMIALCVKRQTQGFQEVQRFIEEHNIREGDTTPEAKIFTDCFHKWQDSNGHPDWSMIGLCVKRQWAGYKELNP